ncbi:hypothetical protein LPJ77_005876 [Coemansia sp. RSA 2523]|nr:hypothetical protein LPJ58_003094 [Coemansia sp. RSA 1591]KAJ1802084.1 hypothetical protein LPJ77_005876 [Coemansia sp. RSA 2523]KAJ2153389.1 hypothetical protein J3F82_002004 [Coemansia sp. RSA 637]
MFRNTSARDTLQSQQSGSLANRNDTHSSDPTYYDVLKCTNEFSTPSMFFSRSLKPAHSNNKQFPWASRSAIPGVGVEPVGNKHKLRRSVATDSGDMRSESGASSSVFSTRAESELPPSVFRLPSSKPADSAEPWALRGMTSGGRALRKASQAPLSRFDRKVTLV